MLFCTTCKPPSSLVVCQKHGANDILFKCMHPSVLVIHVHFISFCTCKLHCDVFSSVVLSISCSQANFAVPLLFGFGMIVASFPGYVTCILFFFILFPLFCLHSFSLVHFCDRCHNSMISLSFLCSSVCFCRSFLFSPLLSQYCICCTVAIGYLLLLCRS